MGTNSYIQVPPDSTGKKMYAMQHSVNSNTVQSQVFHIGDPDNPTYQQKVDIRGQANVRFAEGSPGLDAFGNLRSSEATILGGYEYSNGDQADLFQDLTATGGNVNYTAASATTTLSVTSSNGSSVKRTTNRYHYYQPGNGTLVLTTTYLGDAGKANNTRRWGFYDDDNGLFFELAGTTLNVVRRSKVTGVVVEERVPQASWNSDPMDGTGISGIDLDLTKGNLYWIDLAWLGVGAVRFGVVAPDGSRWVAHTFENPNSNTGPYMATGTLPIRLENFNTGATSGTSEIHHICTAVYSESQTDYTFWRFSDIERSTPVTVTTDTHILSMRPKSTNVGGGANRAGIYPDYLSVYVTGGNVKISIYDDCTLTSPSWTAAESLAESDITGTIGALGTRFRTFYVPAGVTNIDLSPYYELNDEGYHRLADNTGGYIFTLVATKLDGTTVTMAATLGYRELN